MLRNCQIVDVPTAEKIRGGRRSPKADKPLMPQNIIPDCCEDGSELSIRSSRKVAAVMEVPGISLTIRIFFWELGETYTYPHPFF